MQARCLAGRLVTRVPPMGVLRNLLWFVPRFLLWLRYRIRVHGADKVRALEGPVLVLRDVPEAKIVLARTRGLWGSRFSYGWDGKKPPFVKRLLQGAGLILANLIFFAPRRNVEITLEPIDRARLPGLDREVLNPFLE